MINTYTEKKITGLFINNNGSFSSGKQNQFDFSVSHKHVANIMKIKRDRRAKESQAGKKREHKEKSLCLPRTVKTKKVYRNCHCLNKILLFIINISWLNIK
jgi:hypothetical protein